MVSPEPAATAWLARQAAELFGWIMQITDNTGGTDEHLALTFLCGRYFDTASWRTPLSAFFDRSVKTTDVAPPDQRLSMAAPINYGREASEQTVMTQPI
jgi:hypothetical protein